MTYITLQYCVQASDNKALLRTNQTAIVIRISIIGIDYQIPENIIFKGVT